MFKEYSNVCFSRVNLSLSVALKVELNLAFRVLSKRGFSKRFSMSLKRESVSSPVEDIPGFLLMCASFKFVNENGVPYRIGSCVLVSLDSQGNPVFGVVKSIFVNSQKKVCFSLELLFWDVYDPHRHAYLVSMSSEYLNVPFEKLPLRMLVLLHTLPCKSLAVSLPHAL